jgi:hypothetical protein
MELAEGEPACVFLVNFNEADRQHLRATHTDSSIIAIDLREVNLSSGLCAWALLGFGSADECDAYVADLIILKLIRYDGDQPQDVVELVLGRIACCTSIVVIGGLSDDVRSKLFSEWRMALGEEGYVLSLREFGGGYSVGYDAGASRRVRAVSEYVASFMRPLGTIVVGIEAFARGDVFTPPLNGDPCVVIAEK